MTTIVREDSTLKLPVFHGNGKEDLEQHWFVYKFILLVKKIVDNHVKIALLETTFRDHALVWYMKFKSTTPTGVGRTMIEIQQEFFKEFWKPKLES